MYEKVHGVHRPSRTELGVKIDDPSGRRIGWRLRLTEFDFEVQYKRSKIKTQADALSRFNMTGETILHDENDGITVFHLERIDVEFERKNSPDEVDFSDAEYAAVDELYAAMDYPASPVINF